MSHGGLQACSGTLTGVRGLSHTWQFPLDPLPAGSPQSRDPGSCHAWQHGQGVSTAVSLKRPARQTSAAPDRQKAQKYSLKVGLRVHPQCQRPAPQARLSPSTGPWSPAQSASSSWAPSHGVGTGLGVPGLGAVRAERPAGALLNLAGPAFRAAGPWRRQPDHWLDTGHGSSTSGAVTPHGGIRERPQGTPRVCTSTPTPGRWPEEGATSTQSGGPHRGAAGPRHPQEGRPLGGCSGMLAATRGRCWPQAAGREDHGDAHPHPGRPCGPHCHQRGQHGKEGRGPGVHSSQPQASRGLYSSPSCPACGDPCGSPDSPILSKAASRPLLT